MTVDLYLLVATALLAIVPASLPVLGRRNEVGSVVHRGTTMSVHPQTSDLRRVLL